MSKTFNQNPEQKARDQIDDMLRAAGWAVQSKKKVDLGASKGVAVREYQTDVGPPTTYCLLKPEAGRGY